MNHGWKTVNIALIVIAVILGGILVYLNCRPPRFVAGATDAHTTDSVQTLAAQTVEIDTVRVAEAAVPAANRAIDGQIEIPATRLADVDPRRLAEVPAFRKEALAVLNNRLEETDSLSRRKILSYCEHLRTAYTTRDIDFLRQVFSQNALIIVGNVVKTGKKYSPSEPSVAYAVRSKSEYLARLEKVFAANKSIRADFSNFKIMRHPTMEGIYGVTLRQKYATDTYSDDGYLFLLWDFRNPSMPLIHVRTWQPAPAIASGDEIIDISDFNLE